MHARSVAAIALVVALVAGGLVAAPGFGTDALPSYPAPTAVPTTVDGVPIDEAPPRAVAVVDRLALLGGDELTAGSATGGDTGAASDPSAVNGGIEARTMSSTTSVELDALSASDLELLAELGLLEPDPAMHETAADTSDTSDPATPTEPGPQTVDVDDATVAAILQSRILEDLDLEVEVVPVIGEHFEVIGSDAEPLTAISGIVEVEERVLGMLFDEEPTYLWQQWALHNTGQLVPAYSDTEVGVHGIPGVDLDLIVGDQPVASATGEGIVIAVIDTPFDLEHPALQGRWQANPADVCAAQESDGPADGEEPGDCFGYNFLTDEPTATGTADTSAHATHIAGTLVAGAPGEVRGIAPDARIMPLVVSAGNGDVFDMTDVARAIDYAIDHGVDLISLSLGTAPDDRWPDTLPSVNGVKEAIVRAGTAGIPVIAAAGNRDRGVDLDTRPVFPASFAGHEGFEHVLAVGAIDHHARRPIWSNYGRETVGVAAPGAHIMSTLPDNDYGYMNGTSMAVPHVVGVAALLLEANAPALEDQDSAADFAIDLVRSGVLTMDWVGVSLAGVRVSLAGALGQLGPPMVSFAGLGGSVGPETAATRTHLTTTVQVDPPEDIHVAAMTVTLATHYAGRVHGVVNHPLVASTDAAEVAPTTPPQEQTPTAATTNAEGSRGVAFEDDGSVDLEVELPPGDYAWVVEFHDRSLGAYAAAFTVVDRRGSDDDGEEQPPVTEEHPATTTDPTTNTDPTTSTDPTTGGNDGDNNSDDGNQPGGNQPGGNDSTDNQPGDNDSTGNQPGDNDSTDNQPGDNGPTENQPGDNDSTDNQPGDNDPTDNDSGGETGAIRPSEGTAGTVVRIHGIWDSRAYASFGTLVATIVDRTETYLMVRAPAMAYAGPVDITVAYRQDGFTHVQAFFPNGFTYTEGSLQPEPTPGTGGGGGETGGGETGGGTGGGETGGNTGGGTGGGETGDDDGNNGSQTSPSGPGEGVSDPEPDGTLFGSGPRTVGDTHTVNGLELVQLGPGHPGSALPSSLWPPTCEGAGPCPGIPVLG